MQSYFVQQLEGSEEFLEMQLVTEMPHLQVVANPVSDFLQIKQRIKQKIKFAVSSAN